MGVNPHVKIIFVYFSIYDTHIYREREFINTIGESVCVCIFHITLFAACITSYDEYKNTRETNAIWWCYK